MILWCNAMDKELLRPQRSVRNRLQSIDYDSQWVREVSEAFGRPLVPNERCGLWYVDPDEAIDTAYFKSTDGHTNEWSFSTRRLNFHLLSLINTHNGVIVVDSTRRGKTVPDALSKTIPIWCATLNYVAYGHHDSNWLFTPHQFISKNESHQMMQLIPEFAKRLQDLQLISSHSIRERLGGKYLRPLWIYPGQMLPMAVSQYEEFHPVICCVASERSDDGMKKMDGYIYVQGAADDHELWGAKLNPELYWLFKDVLLDKSLNDTEILDIIDTLILPQKEYNVQGVVQLTAGIYIGQVVNNLTKDDITMKTIILSEQFTSTESSLVTHYSVACSKKGSNELRRHLPQILNVPLPVLILCDTGTDISVGVAIALLATRYNLQWESESRLLVTKDVIKRHLAKILELKKVNPSRSTLQAVNTCIM